MTPAVAHLDSVLNELARLGVRAEGIFDEGGHPGVTTVRGADRTATYILASGAWDTSEEAREWAQVVASRARGVLA